MRKKIWILLVVFSLFGSASVLAAGSNLFKGYEVVGLKVNGKPLVTDVPAINFDGTTMVPLRDIADALNSAPVFNSGTSTVNIVKPDVNMLVVNDIQLTKDNIPVTLKTPFGRVKQGLKQTFWVYAAVDEAPIGELYFKVDILDPDGNKVFNGSVDGTVLKVSSSPGQQQCVLTQPIKEMTFTEKGKYAVQLLVSMDEQKTYQVIGEKTIQVN